jgi:hypothetical protein
MMGEITDDTLSTRFREFLVKLSFIVPALLDYGAMRITAATRRAPERRGQGRRP